MSAEISLSVDGARCRVAVDPRTTLLDLLRDGLGNFSPKKGCDHGQCGACTVLYNRRRVLSCLMLAAACDGAEITTAAGLTPDGRPHPVQREFVDQDAFQCGYCTPGQVCSAVGVLDEIAAGWPSHVTEDIGDDPALTEHEIAERMSGNLCRCGAYVNIVAAVLRAGGERS
ncbi:MAG TPA: 2Fe-2S iron-sulfur cluster-binding protein [Pseudonocardiaceae bacterium]|jgi:xanthine dehydrogenase YagT iron-sulfur-binding subunit|nr:2Fe-2S iron-sulfur cluster-binding protein [Pseudonocardiaceae bacterium]